MNLDQYLSYPNRRLAVQSALGAAVARSAGSLLRKRLPPSLTELANLTGGLHGDVTRMLAETEWLSGAFTADRLAELAAEQRKLNEELAERYRTLSLAFPSAWAVEAGTSFLLYSLVRVLRPSAMIELGVGNGHSSFFILRALEVNGTGTLHSIDIEPEAGSLLTNEERERWDFRLVSRKRTTRSLATELDRLPVAEICFHDAGHAYLPQYFELSCMWSKLDEAGVLVCDDANTSYAFIDFCEETGAAAQLLVDGRKAVALVPRSASRLGPRPSIAPSASAR